jgi:N,N'-diacetyllegionaminate synthase
MLKRLELSESAHRELILCCTERNIEFFSTAFDVESIDLLVRLGQAKFKIPSGEITNLPYLRHMGKFGKPIIMSTGMANLSDIEAAIDQLELSGTRRDQITLLHCTTEYPTPMDEVNLSAMQSLQKTFGVSVGYSDHTRGIEVAIAAVSLGARVIEKHFTLDRSLPGPDHKASLEPDELAAMICAIRNIELAMGDGVKRLTPSEIKNKPVVRKSLVASREIKAGECFSSDNLTVKRPGTGVSPMLWDEIIGKKALKDFIIDELITI